MNHTQWIWQGLANKLHRVLVALTTAHSMNWGIGRHGDLVIAVFGDGTIHRTFVAGSNISLQIRIERSAPCTPVITASLCRTSTGVRQGVPRKVGSWERLARLL